MAIWWLDNQNDADQGLFHRFKSLVDINHLDIDKALKIVNPGDIVLCTGVTDKFPGDEIATQILKAGGNLMVMPPYQEQHPFPTLLGFTGIHVQATSFNPGKVVDTDFKSASGMEEVVILYNQAFTTFPGTPVVITANGYPVVVRYRPRSTWGSILLVTLLLGSASARSIHHHRVAFLTGLVIWLGDVKSEVQQNTPRDNNNQDLRKATIYPLLILMLSRLPSDRPVSNTDILDSYEFVLKRLGKRFTQDTWNSDWLDNLENIGLVNKESTTSWKIQSEFLIKEMNRLHLAAYLRRMV